MMDTVTYYDPATGKIAATYSGTRLEDMDLVYVDCEKVDGSHDGLLHYVPNGEVTERPASPVTRTDLTLHDVPAGSKLHINGVSYDAAGTVDLEFPLSGTYSLRVESFPYLDFVDEVTV
jgi:hypothetical protein